MHLSTIPDSKILKKGVQIGPKLKRGLGTQESHSTLLECQLALPSANWLKFVARLGDSLIEIRPTFFDFLKIRTHSNSYLISLKHPNLYK